MGALPADAASSGRCRPPGGRWGQVDERDIRRAARVSGMRGDALPSLEQVERRRFELWLMSTVLLVGLTAALGLLIAFPIARRLLRGQRDTDERDEREDSEGARKDGHAGGEGTDEVHR